MVSKNMFTCLPIDDVVVTVNPVLEFLHLMPCGFVIDVSEKENLLLLSSKSKLVITENTRRGVHTAWGPLNIQTLSLPGRIASPFPSLMGPEKTPVSTP